MTTRLKKMVFLPITLLFLSACMEETRLPIAVGDSAPDTPGKWAVGHRNFVMIDANRNDRPLNVDVWYPVDLEDTVTGTFYTYPLIGNAGIESPLALADKPVAEQGNFPLIVFSHGFEGINVQSTSLMENLASHGFFVISPEHTGNSQNSPGDSREQVIANRVPDVSFVISQMLIRNSSSGDIFAGSIDNETVGVTGHSFGGNTTMGSHLGWGGQPADPRVDAIAPISGQLETEFSSVLSSVSIPTLLLGGTLDEAVPITENDFAFEMISNAPALYKASIIGATHTHFANICDIGDFLRNRGIFRPLWPLVGARALLEPWQDTCSRSAFDYEEGLRLQNLYITAFFKRHLLGLTEYDQYLTTQYASDNEPDMIFVRKDSID